jgi:uncharacterized protein (TIGR02597 family)
MKTGETMKMKASAITAAALLALTAQAAHAAEAVGYNTLTVPANSDVLVSVPFNQNAEGSFTVSSVTADGVTVTNGLTANAYTNGYYVRFTTGGGEGLWSTISANGTGGFTLANTNALTGVLAGDTFKVYPHQTLASVFPDGMESVSFKKSASALSHSTEILFPNTGSVGINKGPAATYYYYNSAWRKAGSSASLNFNSTAVSPQEYFILRNRSTSELTYVASGDVETLTTGRYISTETTKNDIAAVSGRPVAMTLAELGLAGTPAFVTSPSTLSHKDELLVFNNSAAGLNKGPAATYFYYNGAWRKSGASASLSFDNELVDAGAALIIRKAAGTAGTAEWNQSSPF